MRVNHGDRRDPEPTSARPSARSPARRSRVRPRGRRAPLRCAPAGLAVRAISLVAGLGPDGRRRRRGGRLRGRGPRCRLARGVRAAGAGCLAVRLVGSSWRLGEQLVHRCAPTMVRRALVLVVGASVGLGAATGASAAVSTPPPTAPAARRPSTASDLGWVVTTPLEEAPPMDRHPRSIRRRRPLPPSRRRRNRSHATPVVEPVATPPVAPPARRRRHPRPTTSSSPRATASGRSPHDTSHPRRPTPRSPRPGRSGTARTPWSSARIPA